MKTLEQPPVAGSYLKLIRELPLRHLRNAADHEKATSIVLRLSGVKKDRGTLDYLHVLADLIVEYEKRMGFGLELGSISTAEYIKHRIEARELTITAVAKTIGISQSNLSEMLSGKRGWSKTAIRGLTKLFGIPAQRFLDD